MSLLAYVGSAWWAVAVFLLVVTSIGTLVQPWVQRRRPKRRDQPPVSAILPIKLLDNGFEATLASMLDQHYPEYEVLVSAAEEVSPAIDAAAKILRAFPQRPTRILQSDAVAAASPKLNVLVAPLAVARHDIVMTKDSNITLAPEDLAVFASNLVPGVGLVVAVPVAVHPRHLAGHIEAFLLNGHARLLLTASALGLGFGVGKTMMFRRSDLARIGGLDAIGYTIAEDSALSKALAAKGLRTTFAHRTIAQEIGPRRLREIYDRQARWSVIRRAQEPLSYPLEPLTSPLPAALAAALAAPLVGFGAGPAFGLTLLAWFCVEIAVAAAKGWEVSLWSPAAFVGREIVALAAWSRAWFRQDVVWAEGRYDLTDEAEQAAKVAAARPPC